jgi:hypothetical protein
MSEFVSVVFDVDHRVKCASHLRNNAVVQKICADDSREVKNVVSNHCAFSDSIGVLENQISDENLEDKGYTAFDDQVFLSTWVVVMKEFE